LQQGRHPGASPPAVKRAGAVVHGRVQGVGFRAAAHETGRRLGLEGWVRNRPDGTVEVRAQGDPHTLEQFHDFLRHGPRMARVTNVDWFWEAPADDLGPFEIK
jgi:acylphosphatase